MLISCSTRPGVRCRCIFDWTHLERKAAAALSVNSNHGGVLGHEEMSRQMEIGRSLRCSQEIIGLIKFPPVEGISPENS